jgi:aminoglycoside phosphotransferase (APT) family kinase protein
MKSDWGNPIYFLQRRAWAREMVPIQTDLRLVIRHGDLNALNVLVKEDELTGSVDLT